MSKEWTPTAKDMPEFLRAAKRVNIRKTELTDWDWWVGHGKDESCHIEGEPSHWFWLAYTLIGLTKPEDCPYAENKPLPISKEQVVERVAAMQGIASAAPGSVAELVKAGAALVERWDTPNWNDAKHTGDFIHALRTALAAIKIEGGE